MLKRLLFFSLLGTLLVSSPCIAGEQASVKLAVLPFTINADRDLSYLRDGVVDMFVAQLAAEKGLMALKLPADDTEGRSGVNEDGVARRIGGRLGADHVLYGSLTVFGNSISLDAKVLGVADDRGPIVFSRQASSMDGLIPAVHGIAREVAAPYSLSPPPVVTPSPVAAGDNRTFWKSQNFDLEISGISAGDVNADGKAEVVFITAKTLQVFRMENRRLVEITSRKAEGEVTFLCVDIADINGNGRAEVFVTAINTAADRMESLVLEWDGTSLTPVPNDPAWFYRILLRPAQKPLLVGQKKSLREPFLPGIYEMTWKEGGYQVGKKWNLPPDATLLGLTTGDIMNDGREIVAFLDRQDRLRLFLATGELEWKSEEKYGGSERFIDYSTSGIERDDEKERFYLSQRIMTVDADQNGRNEVLVVKNESLTGRFLERYRSYGSSRFEILAWDGLGLSATGSTAKISNYISDFYIADLDGDGATELLAAVVSERNSLITGGKSAVITYALGSLKK